MKSEIQSDEKHKTIAVVFMYNPVDFKKSKNSTIATQSTLNAIFEVFEEAFRNGAVEVRIYNLTVSAGDIRGDLWPEENRDDDASLERIKNQLLEASDDPLSDLEIGASWWIAWNLAGKQEWINGNIKFQRVERQFRAARWEQIKKMTRDSKQYIGLTERLKIVSRFTTEEPPLEHGFFIHPSRFAKKSSSPEHHVALSELRASLKF